jgi:bifunctional enzyme CysN/CysC
MVNHKQSTNDHLLLREKINIVIAGHVDHGKSTIVGRLLADTDSLPHGKLEQVRETCKKNSKPFEYAFLLDALKDEQSQGITIDVARVFFKTKKRDYIIIDAPGHIEFLKNMVTGASRAETAVLVIDAQEGVQENSRRHGYMISMLGIKQLIVVVNKMDLIDYQQDVFDNIVKEYSAFLKEINITPDMFIPASGMMGDSIASLDSNMPWYKGSTVLEGLDGFRKEWPKKDKAFRMPVQDIYKFTNYGDSRRVVAGTIDTGELSIGDEVVFYPSGKRSKVKNLEVFNAPNPDTVEAGYATSFTLEEQIYVTRGEIATKHGELLPQVSSRMLVNLFWLGRKPMVKNKEYMFKLGGVKIPVKIEEIVRVINASNLDADEKQEQINRHEVAECVFKLKKPIAFDKASDIANTSRFVIVDEYEITGGGIIKDGIEDMQSDIRDKVFRRNFKWEKSFISHETRNARYNQKSVLILVTGGKDTGKKKIAKSLEESLFADGKFVYFLGIGNLLYGVDADIKKSKNNRHEHIRRLAEVAHLMLDSGMILIVTAVGLNQEELEIIKTVNDPDKIETLWVGNNVTTDLNFDYHFTSGEDADEAVEILKSRFQEKGIIFKPW